MPVASIRNEMLPASAARLLRMLYTEPVCALVRSCAMPRRPASNVFTHPTHLWVGLLILAPIEAVNFGVPGSPILGEFQVTSRPGPILVKAEAQQREFGGLVRFSGAFGPTTAFQRFKNPVKGPPFAAFLQTALLGIFKSRNG